MLRDPVKVYTIGRLKEALVASMFGAGQTRWQVMGFRASDGHCAASTVTRQMQNPLLYFSPIDNRLHLLGAEGGLWNLDDQTHIRLHNLSADHYIDAWVREQTVAMDNLSESGFEAKGIPVEALYAFDDHFLYSGPTGVELLQANYEFSSFQVKPPSDHHTWEAFRTTVLPYTEQRRNPDNLRSWLDAFPSESILYSPNSGMAQNIRVTPTGFRFTIELNDQIELGPQISTNAPEITPGLYVIEYNGQYSIEPALPLEPDISVQVTPYENNRTGVDITITNYSNNDTGNLRFVAEVYNNNQVSVVQVEKAVYVNARDQETIFLQTSQTVDDWIDVIVHVYDHQGYC
jgi:hypothetical protein